MTTELLDAFTRAYIECALWSSTDDDGNWLDQNFNSGHIAPTTLKQMVEDCKEFQYRHYNDIKDNLTRAGHDFWLTRNHHGAGFWDGDYPTEVGKRLTEASHAWGDVDLIVGNDGLIY